MPFSLENAPEIILTAMDVILLQVRLQDELVHINDIDFFSRSTIKHVGKVRQVV